MKRLGDDFPPIPEDDFSPIALETLDEFVLVVQFFQTIRNVAEKPQLHLGVPEEGMLQETEGGDSPLRIPPNHSFDGVFGDDVGGGGGRRRKVEKTRRRRQDVRLSEQKTRWQLKRESVQIQSFVCLFLCLLIRRSARVGPCACG